MSRRRCVCAWRRAVSRKHPTPPTLATTHRFGEPFLDAGPAKEVAALDGADMLAGAKAQGTPLCQIGFSVIVIVPVVVHSAVGRVRLQRRGGRHGRQHGVDAVLGAALHPVLPRVGTSPGHEEGTVSGGGGGWRRHSATHAGALAAAFQSPKDVLERKLGPQHGRQEARAVSRPRRGAETCSCLRHL